MSIVDFEQVNVCWLVVVYFWEKKKKNYDIPEIYLGPWSISELEHFGKAVNDWVLKTYLYTYRYIHIFSSIFTTLDYFAVP